LWLAEGALTPATAAVRDLLIAFVEEHYLESLPAGAERIDAASAITPANSPISR
jgi:hypothetical protein